MMIQSTNSANSYYSGGFGPSSAPQGVSTGCGGGDGFSPSAEILEELALVYRMAGGGRHHQPNEELCNLLGLTPVQSSNGGWQLEGSGLAADPTSSSNQQQSPNQQQMPNGLVPVETNNGQWSLKGTGLVGPSSPNGNNTQQLPNGLVPVKMNNGQWELEGTGLAG